MSQIKRPGLSSYDYMYFKVRFKTDVVKKFLLPISLGFAGMFMAHIIILPGFGPGLKIMLYVVAYPVVYTFLAFLLTRNNPQWWLSNSICILLIPSIYWYLLLLSSERPPFMVDVIFTDSSGMFLILPLTFVLAVFISFSVFKRNLRGKKQFN